MWGQAKGGPDAGGDPVNDPTQPLTAPAGDPEPLETLPLGEGPATQRRLDTRPATHGQDLDTLLTGWNRYEVRGCLGVGGMGRVYKAWDPRLRRLVALKFLLVDRLDLLSRFRLEAQSQARVNHPNVVKVFEVGEVGGQTYLAMEYVDGCNLREALPRLGLEEKLEILAQVAEGVQAAHRHGIVHRDLKPTNILVAREEGEHWRAWVTDFGLARELEGAGLTLDGSQMGTPAYMSPEQIRGDRAAVGRPSDIYSLGVTLFEVFTGEFPYGALTPMEVLARTMVEDPRPLRRVRPGLPQDLETIVATCLEREPHRRYPSARLLAEDLRRLRDGEPIQARPASLPRRLLRRARKSPRLTGALLAVTLGLGFLAAWSLLQWRYAARQARLDQGFRNQAFLVEQFLRQAQLLPIHDLQPDRARADQTAADLAREMASQGPAAQGPGHYALGRIALATEDPARALTHLEAAWRAGFTLPEVALKAQEALRARYRRDLDEIPRYLDPEARAERQARVERTFREALGLWGSLGPALAGEEKILGEAEEAYGRKDYTSAVRAAQTLRGLQPWRFEALLVQGDALFRRAQDHLDGGAYPEALAAAGEAARAYGEGLEIARSSARFLAGLARCRLLELQVAYNQGNLEAAHLTRLREACGRIREVDPASAEARALYCDGGLLRVYWQINRAEIRDPVLEEIPVVARELVALRPDSADAAGFLGLSLARLAYAQFKLGGDFLPTLQESRALLEGALARAPGLATLDYALAANATMETIHRYLGGEDPTPAVRRAMAHGRRAVRVAPGNVTYRMGVGVAPCYLSRYRLLKGQPLGPETEEGIRELQTALRAVPKPFLPHSPLGFLLAARGQEAALAGRDPLPLWREALRVLDEGIPMNPAYVEQYGVRAQLLAWWAQHDRRQGRSAAGRVAQARRDGARGLALDPLSWWALEALLELESRPGLGDPVRAEALAARIRRAYPRDPVLAVLRGAPAPG